MYCSTWRFSDRALFTRVRGWRVLRRHHARIRERLTRRRHMPLVRVEETDSGGFTVLNLQMVARVKCAGFDGRQQEHRATEFSEVGMLRGLSLTAFACGVRRLWWRRLGFVANRESKQRENHHRGSS